MYSTYHGIIDCIFYLVEVLLVNLTAKRDTCIRTRLALYDNAKISTISTMRVDIRLSVNSTLTHDFGTLPRLLTRKLSSDIWWYIYTPIRKELVFSQSLGFGASIPSELILISGESRPRWATAEKFMIIG